MLDCILNVNYPFNCYYIKRMPVVYLSATTPVQTTPAAAITTTTPRHQGKVLQLFLFY